jgi:hypothetical protein
VEEEALFARGFNLPEQHRLWRDAILPRTIIPLYWAYKVALFPFYIAGKRPRKFERVAIESGKIGWTHVYFEELYGSATDYFGPDTVTRQVIDRDQSYFPQFKISQKRNKPDLFIIDVRTPTQSWRASLIETFQMSRLLLTEGITPLVVLTDAYYRRHRWQAAVLTAYRGSVVTFSATSIVNKIFPHSRIAGPLFMPISASRLEWLRENKQKIVNERDVNAAVKISFIGSMYSPREEFLEEVQKRLASAGIELNINGDKAGTSNDEYWNTLLNADIILTTTLQGPERKFLDWGWVRQAVFRYSETLAAGTTLVAGPVDGGFPYFENGRDFVEFESVDECVSALTKLVADPTLRHVIGSQGHATISNYVKHGVFWKDSLAAMDN